MIVMVLCPYAYGFIICFFDACVNPFYAGNTRVLSQNEAFFPREHGRILGMGSSDTYFLTPIRLLGNRRGLYIS